MANEFIIRKGFLSRADSNISGSQSTTPQSGALVLDGGLGINGDVNTGGDIHIDGTLTAATKSFLIPHPIKPGHKLQYGVLEGPEHSVFIRGKLENEKIIKLPDYWKGLVDPSTITVNLTAFGSHQILSVQSISITEIKISGVLRNVNCYYTVFAERIDVSKLKVEL